MLSVCTDKRLGAVCRGRLEYVSAYINTIWEFFDVRKEKASLLR